MPRSNKNKIKDVQLRCLRCRQQFTGGYYPFEKIRSYLSTHIWSKPDCLNHYLGKNLIHGADIVLQSSIVDDEDQQPSKKLRMPAHPFPVTDFGLTGTSNGPCPPHLLGIEASKSHKIDHSLLNRQTLYVGHQPSISRDNILASVQHMQQKNPIKNSNTSTEACHADSPPTPINLTENSDGESVHSPMVLCSDDNNLSEDDFDIDQSYVPAEYHPPDGSQDNLLPSTVHVGSNPYMNVTPMDNRLTVEVELLHILIESGCHLNMFPRILKWVCRAACRPGNESLFQTMRPIRTYNTVLRYMRRHMHRNTNDTTDDTRFVPDGFQRTSIPWLPNNTPLDLYIRPFHVALDSLLRKTELMQQSKLSLPNVDNPFSYLNNPEVDVISELHHGTWWRNSWREAGCNPNKNEMLVPIILYMDGISLDTHGRLSLTPLNMTLGIFSTETRKSNYAWETLYFHPHSSQVPNEKHDSKNIALDNLKNLHRGIATSLSSFWQLCKTETIFKDLPWNNRTYNVSMKFAIAFVIGDTELHDKLCGRYSSRSSGTNYICRHCNCPTDDLVNPKAQECTRLWIPEDFAIPEGDHDPDHWKNLSHHPIENAFDDLDFGSNIHKIHMATPGECLHMHQLGVAKRSLEVLKAMIEQKPKDDPRRGDRAGAWKSLSSITYKFGSELSRQSDRNFPRTSFSLSTILEHTKKNGKDYPGVLLSLVVALLSKEAREVLNKQAYVDNDTINDWVRAFEIILFFDEFLQRCGLRISDLDSLPSVVDKFITTLTNTFPRGIGMGNRTVKNHLYFHLHQYISMFGPPSGWDSSPCESHHKTDIKAPSKNTQKNDSSLIQQTFRRKMEYSDIHSVMNSPAYLYRDLASYERERNRQAGSRYKICWDENNQPSMKWSRKSNKNYAHLPQDVLKFCCETFLPRNQTHGPVLPDAISGFTEFNHQPEVGGEYFKYRSHPSYRGDSGQSCNLWYDWANFVYFQDGDDSEAIAPGQILCLLDLTPEQAQLGTKEPVGGPHAVVRSFMDPPKRFRQSKIVQRGLVGHDFYVYPCSSISGPVAVVHNSNAEGGNEFFVVRNKSHWVKCFHDLLQD